MSPTTSIFHLAGILLGAFLVLSGNETKLFHCSRTQAALSAIKEWKSMRYLTLLYVSAGSFIITRAVFNFFAISSIFLTFFRVPEKVIRKLGIFSVLFIPLVWAGAITFCHSRWELISLESLAAFKKRGDPGWWKYVADAQVYPPFSQPWWRSFAEIYSDNLNVTVWACLGCLAVVIVEQFLINFLLLLESLVDSVLRRIWHKDPLQEVGVAFLDKKDLGPGPQLQQPRQRSVY